MYFPEKVRSLSKETVLPGKEVFRLTVLHVVKKSSNKQGKHSLTFNYRKLTSHLPFYGATWSHTVPRIMSTSLLKWNSLKYFWSLKHCLNSLWACSLIFVCISCRIWKTKHGFIGTTRNYFLVIRATKDPTGVIPISIIWSTLTLYCTKIKPKPEQASEEQDLVNIFKFWKILSKVPWIGRRNWKSEMVSDALLTQVHFINSWHSHIQCTTC